MTALAYCGLEAIDFKIVRTVTVNDLVKDTETIQAIVSPDECRFGFARHYHRTLTQYRATRNYPVVVTFAINTAVTTMTWMCARNAPKIFASKGGPGFVDRKTGQCCHRRCHTRCRLIDLGVTRAHADLISAFDVQSDITP